MTTHGHGRTFDILVIDDDAMVVSTVRAMYESLIARGALAEVLPGGNGTVTTASDPGAAEKILEAHFAAEPQLLQILHVDERMPPFERGSQFVDRMRRRFTQENIAALLVTAYATDVSVLNSRQSGVYRYLSKPVNRDRITPHLLDVIRMIRLKDRPEKKEADRVFIFKTLTDSRHLLEYFQTRFRIWDQLNYIPPELKSETGLEVDDYDKFSVPVGGFAVGGSEELAILARIITTRRQEPYEPVIQDILDHRGDGKLQDVFRRSVQHPLTLLRDCDANTIEQFLTPHGGLAGAVEYSRIMVAGPEYRGYSLSTRMTQFHNMYTKYVLRAKVGVASCLVKHVAHNCRNGFTGTIPGIEVFDAGRVEQVAQAIYVDLNCLTDTPPEFHERTVRGMYDLYAKRGFVCSCQRSDCYRDNYRLDGTDECERRKVGW